MSSRSVKLANPKYDAETKAVIENLSDLYTGRFIIMQRPKAGDIAIQAAVDNISQTGGPANQQALLIEPGDVVWSVNPAKDSGDRDISDLRHYIEEVCREHDLMDADGEPMVCWPRHGAMTKGEHGVLVPRITQHSDMHPKNHGGIVPKNALWKKTDCYLSRISSRVAQRGSGAMRVKRF